MMKKSRLWDMTEETSCYSIHSLAEEEETDALLIAMTRYERKLEKLKKDETKIEKLKKDETKIEKLKKDETKIEKLKKDENEKSEKSEKSEKAISGKINFELKSLENDIYSILSDISFLNIK